MKVTLVPFRKVGLALQLAGAVVFGAFLGLAGSGQAMATSEQGAAAVAEVTVEVEAGLVTLDARNAPLEGVLKAIGEAAEFGVTLAHDPELLVTTSFANLPLEKAIRRLAGDISMVMLYAQPDGEGGGVAAWRKSVSIPTRIEPPN